jgi:hypothetical protein
MKNLILLILLSIALDSFSQCGPAYVAPSFQLSKTDETCTRNNGSISIINFAGGSAPFTWTIVSPSTSGVGTTNGTGTFNNLPPGQYYIQLEDGCGTIRVRQTTILPYSFSFTYSIIQGNCGEGEITISANPAGSYTYGVVTNDTTWSTNPVFTFHLQTHVTVLVKDACGNIRSETWNSPPGFLPYIETIDHYFWCTDWNAIIRAHGFTNPTYCLYHMDGTLVNCNDSGLYVHIPYGEYYAIVSDSCYRDSFYVNNPPAYDGVQLDAQDFSCTTFSMHVDGYNTNICLYDNATNLPVGCHAAVDSLSGWIFTDLPYGTYYAFIYDPCADTTVKVTKTVGYPYKVTMLSYANCNPGFATLLVDFDPASPSPRTIKIYNPDGSLLGSYVTNLFSNTYTLPGLASGQYMIVGADQCGFADTAYITPSAMSVEKHLTVVNKCPGAVWANGSGDAIAKCITSLGTVQPEIIKKNGATVSIAYDNVDTAFHFIDLEPATYILKYTFTSCSQLLLYDTFTIAPYVLPVNAASSIYQCDDKSISLSGATAVTGGLAPYTYQIIGSTPSSPSLLTGVQSTPAFTINNGVIYSSIKIRVVDGCGNSAIGEVAISIAQDFAITAKDTCFFRNMILSVDSAANAQYFWYRKITPTDSVLVGSSPVYTTYITPDSIGLYECKIVINNGCVIRLPSFNLTGLCYGTLPVDTSGGGPTAINRNNFIKVYPNPSRSSIHIQFNKKKKDDYLIEVFNSVGQKLYENRLYGIDRKDFIINKTFPRGQYFIRINDQTFPHLVQ